MKKFKLNPNQLKVDSFEADQPNTKEGTVKGNLAATLDIICTEFDTCYAAISCGADTCIHSCIDTCNTCLT